MLNSLPFSVQTVSEGTKYYDIGFRYKVITNVTSDKKDTVELPVCFFWTRQYADITMRLLNMYAVAFPLIKTFL